MHTIQTTIQTIGSWTLAGTIIALGLWGAGYSAWRLWQWTGDAAEMLERNARKPKQGENQRPKHTK